MNQRRRILVPGSNGFLGRSVTARLGPPQHVTPTHCRNAYFPDSVRYAFPDDDLGRIAAQHGADTIIFAAEIEKNQQRPEANEPEFLRAGFGELVRAVRHLRFVYISSDGIFDGDRGLYREADVPRPKTKYGLNLKICEDLVTAHCDNFCIIRLSYLYGHSQRELDGRLRRTKALCESGQEPSYFCDMFKSPIHVAHAADAIVKLALSDYVGIAHVGGPRMSVYDFHRQGMEALGVPGGIQSTKMPDDPQLLRDTSLDVSLCKELISFEPLSINESFFQWQS